jgi:hypothetical protein
MPHITGSRVMHFDDGFLTPGRFPSAVEGNLYPGNEFPFTYEVLTDPISGQTDGLLARCRGQGACPLIMHTDTANEMWQGRASLVATDPLGRQDAPIPDNVRLYYFASAQHIPGSNLAGPICRYPVNPLSYQESQRALITALQRWVANGAEPPPSQYPRLSDGLLVPSLPRDAVGFPEIPAIRYTGRVSQVFLTDHASLPPRPVSDAEYPVRVPRTDGDGNDLGGIRAVDLQVPLGTYTGWNHRADGFLADEPCYLDGSFIPFAATPAERLADGDPRPSLAERYPTRESYVQAVAEAARALVAARYLLPEDAERLVGLARSRDLLPTVAAAP